MFNYMNIDPTEFEEICHEILEKITNQSFRVFGKGTDGGIDIQSDENEKVIGQAKLYINSTQSTTVYSIKSEFYRIKNKEIEQYYLFIGREMSPENIQKIYDEFKTYMKSKENIYTIKEIDELLHKEEFQDIVRNHVKLWLSSTNILELITNRNVFFDCDILLYDIKKELELFVRTDIYNVCKKILETKRNLLILGAPGIGKTTTSKILALYFAQKGYTVRYTDAYNLNELKSAISLDYDKKEFIFLDDCLGQSYLELHEKNENDLIRFIKYVYNNPNKMLLLNSRITVFKEATQRKVDLEKSVRNKDFYIQEINIENLSKLEKAKILYSHLQNKNVPEEYKNQIIKNRNYMKIIENPSYSPRIIDYMTDENRYSKIEPNEYVEEILRAFTKSEYVWEDEFKYRIDKQDRIFLYTLYSISSHIVNENILKQAFLKRMKIENVDTTMSVYEDTLKRLNESFIKIIMINDSRYISVVNPSVNDFLRNKLNENLIEKEKMKDSIMVIEQCNRIIENKIDKEMFIKEKLRNGEFLQFLTNEYNSINDLYLPYIVECDMVDEIEFGDVIRAIEDLHGGYEVLGDYITSSTIIVDLYRCHKYTDKIEDFFRDGCNITYVLEGKDIEDQIEMLGLINNIDAKYISNKDAVVKFVEENLKEEIRHFSEEELEMNVEFDEIVASEIEDLKIEYENDEVDIHDIKLFKENIQKRVIESFKSACANYIEESISHFYNELPDFIFDKMKWIDVESYIDNYMIEKLAKKYIELVYYTPEQDYTYYKKYIYDGYLLNNYNNEENQKIYNIFKQI